jgi:ABC-type glycerol-3-phosphate transport system permease component
VADAGRPSRRIDVQGLLLTGALVALAVIWLAPAAWVLVTSLKRTPDIIRLPPEWIPWPATMDHYREVLFSSSRTARIGRAFVNSTIIALGTVVIVVMARAMAAYPLARMRFPGRNLVFALIVGSLMVPNAVLLIPQYVLVLELGWLSTYQGLIVPEAAANFAFGVFLLRQFFVLMPGELEDAARIDGANAWQEFWNVTLPLLRPTLLLVVTLTMISSFQTFVIFYVMTNGGPLNQTRSLTLNIYENAFRFQNMGWASAMSLILFAMILVVTLVQFRLLRTDWEY